eukprot:Awhi_evm1s15417
MSSKVLFSILLLVILNLSFVNSASTRSREEPSIMEMDLSREELELSPEELSEYLLAGYDDDVQTGELFDEDGNINEVDKNNNFEKAVEFVDLFKKIESLSDSIFSVFGKDLGKAKNIEEELIHLSQKFLNIMPKDTAKEEWDIINSLIDYFKVSGINDEGGHASDTKTIEDKLATLLKHLRTQTIDSRRAAMKMELVFERYIKETADEEAFEINNYKGLTYLQMSHFLTRIADLLLDANNHNKLADVFGFLGDFLILKDTLMHRIDLHLLNLITRKIEAENSESDIVETIDLVIANLMERHKAEENLTLNSLEAQRNEYLDILDYLNENPDFIKYLKVTS